MYSSNLVELPIATGITPDAKGSNVPPWPTFEIFVAFLICLMTSIEVIPYGLSILNIPFMSIMAYLNL